MGTKVKIIIKPDGSIETEVRGIKGQGCTSVLDDLLAGIGTTVEEDATSEFYEDEGQYLTETY